MKECVDLQSAMSNQTLVWQIKETSKIIDRRLLVSKLLGRVLVVNAKAQPMVPANFTSQGHCLSSDELQQR